MVGKEIAVKKYVVRLSAEERAQLDELIRKGKRSAQLLTKARILLKADVGTKTLRYVYDFGDGWEHSIKIERLLDPQPGILYPRLIEASGRCLSEDVGGP